MTSVAKKKGPTRQAALSAQQAKFPRHPVEKALRIAKAIFDQNAGKPTTKAASSLPRTGLGRCCFRSRIRIA
jgi:hypothetical protein